MLNMFGVGEYDDFWSCFYYDNIILIGRGLDFMINFGVEFEDWQQYRKYSYGIRFTGCSGFLSFS